MKKSDALKWEYNAPAFDLTDELHAFMVLARAIGLNNERIGILCGLSGDTINKQMRMIDQIRLASKLIRKHKRLCLVSSSTPIVRVHADW